MQTGPESRAGLQTRFGSSTQRRGSEFDSWCRAMPCHTVAALVRHASTRTWHFFFARTHTGRLARTLTSKFYVLRAHAGIGWATAWVSLRRAAARGLGVLTLFPCRCHSWGVRSANTDLRPRRDLLSSHRRCMLRCVPPWHIPLVARLRSLERCFD